MKIRTANHILVSFGLGSAVLFFVASGCYFSILCKREYGGIQGLYIHIVGLGMVFLFVSMLPRFATIVFNLADRRIISAASSERLDNWLVIDELKRKN